MFNQCTVGMPVELKAGTGTALDYEREGMKWREEKVG
jgi:hypothetical protein